MLLLIDTWLAACFWFSDCTICWIVQPDSESRCSIQVSGRASGWTLPLQAARQFGDKRALHRRVRARHVGDDHDQVLRILLGGLDQLVRPGVGAIAADAVGRRCAPHTRRRFSISARRSMIGSAHNSPSVRGVTRLIGGDKAGEALGVHAAVAVRNDLERDVVDAGKAGGRTVQQARQFPAVALWESAAWRCGSALRSDRSYRAATRRRG